MSLEKVVERVNNTPNGFESLANQVLSDKDKEDFMYDFLDKNRFFKDLLSDKQVK